MPLRTGPQSPGARHLRTLNQGPVGTDGTRPPSKASPRGLEASDRCDWSAVAGPHRVPFHELAPDALGDNLTHQRPPDCPVQALVPKLTTLKTRLGCLPRMGHTVDTQRPQPAQAEPMLPMMPGGPVESEREFHAVHASVKEISPRGQKPLSAAPAHAPLPGLCLWLPLHTAAGVLTQFSPALPARCCSRASGVPASHTCTGAGYTSLT